MRRVLCGSVLALTSVVWVAGLTGCGASHSTAVANAANTVDRTVTTAAANPILAGPWAPDQEGYGHVAPRTVFNGGDPTGLIKQIEWLTWGGSRAVGVGSGFYVAANQITAEGHRAAAVIVAFKLGSCHGRRAYNAVQWYFPEFGEHFSPLRTGYKLCTR